MSPRRGAHASSSSHDNPDNLEFIARPSWDTSLLRKPAYVHQLRRWLTFCDPRFKRLVETYTVYEKHKILAMSDNHIDRILNSVLPTGTFATPTVVGERENVAVGAGAHPGAGGVGRKSVVWV